MVDPVTLLGTVYPRALDAITSSQQKRRRLLVLVHRGVFLTAGSEEHFFIKVTNLSETREVEITHVWFATQPPIHYLADVRRLPARLRPDETWEGWIRVSAVPPTKDAEKLARVRLSNGRVVRSRLNKEVPPVGYVAGGGSR